MARDFDFISGVPGATELKDLGKFTLGSIGFGNLVGGKSERKKAYQEFGKQKTAEAKLAYETGKGTFAELRKTREGIGETYQKNLASARARLSGAGFSAAGGSYEAALTKNMAERDEALKGVQLEEQRFRESETYKTIMQDYQLLTRGAEGKDIRGLQRAGLEFHGAMTGGFTTMGQALAKKSFSGTQLYTDEQFKSITTYGGWMGPEGEGKSAMMDKYYDQYLGRIAPTMQQFEQLQFGTDDQKAAVQKSIDASLKEANQWWKGVESLQNMYKSLDIMKRDYRGDEPEYTLGDIKQLKKEIGRFEAGLG